MINAIFKGLLSACNQLINLVCLPIDLAISAAFPDLSNRVTTSANYLSDLVSNISYVITFIPDSYVAVLLVIFTCQITFIGLDKSVGAITKIYNVIQKIKFW